MMARPPHRSQLEASEKLANQLDIINIIAQIGSVPYISRILPGRHCSRLTRLSLNQTNRGPILLQFGQWMAVLLRATRGRRE